MLLDTLVRQPKCENKVSRRAGAKAHMKIKPSRSDTKPTLDCPKRFTGQALRPAPE